MHCKGEDFLFQRCSRSASTLSTGASEPPPTDPMGFPPGLLPALVKEHLRTEDNYVPLERKEVERAGIPNAAPADSYLLARLDKFHAEMQVDLFNYLMASAGNLASSQMEASLLLLAKTEETILGDPVTTKKANILDIFCSINKQVHQASKLYW